jgi:hypothetical protein
VRLRALVSLLVLTAADYVLWEWSIAEGHDVLSLVAGLTLLPLAAVSLGGLVLAGAQRLGILLGSSSTRARARAHSSASVGGAGHTEQPLHTSTTGSGSSSSRLAA